VYVQLAYVIPQVLNTSFGSSPTINTPQNLGISSQANPMIRSPDPFFCHHKEKQKKAVWPCETNVVLPHLLLLVKTVL